MRVEVKVGEPYWVMVRWAQFLGFSWCRQRREGVPPDEWSAPLGIAIALIKAEWRKVQRQWERLDFIPIMVIDMPDSAIPALVRARESYRKGNGRKHLASEGLARWLLRQWKFDEEVSKGGREIDRLFEHSIWGLR